MCMYESYGEYIHIYRDFGTLKKTSQVFLAYMQDSEQSGFLCLLTGEFHKDSSSLVRINCSYCVHNGLYTE